MQKMNTFLKVKKSLVVVFTKPKYLALALMFTIVLFLIASVLPNLKFLGFVLREPSFSLPAKFSLFYGFLSYLPLNSSLPSKIFLTANLFLGGINLSLATFYFRRKIIQDRLAGAGLVGIMASFLGVGCGACGSVILSSLMGITASTELIGLLPFRGIEFGLIGLVIILVSMAHLSIKIQNPLSCKMTTT